MEVESSRLEVLTTAIMANKNGITDAILILLQLALPGKQYHWTRHLKSKYDTLSRYVVTFMLVERKDLTINNTTFRG